MHAESYSRKLEYRTDRTTRKVTITPDVLKLFLPILRS